MINNVLGIEVKRRLQDITDIKQESGESVKRSLEAKEKADESAHRSDITKKQLEEAIKDGDQVVEVQTLRVDPVSGEAYDTAADRFEANQIESNQRLEQTEDIFDNRLNEIEINVKRPPLPFAPILMDGSDETIKLQNILDWVGENGGGTVYTPRGYITHTINHIPNKVTFRGSGMGVSGIKLKDNALNGMTRQATGLYPKWDVDYFEITDLTYDGNALNNINLQTANDYDLLSSHGISNGYVDPEEDSYNQTDDPDGKRYAKDFLINNVEIKNTIRNSLLLGGRHNQKGHVGTAKLKNAYLDHHIYESTTNGRFIYDNIKIEGFWRGSSVVIESGEIRSLVLENPKPNPSPHYSLTALIEHRDRGQHFKNRPSIDKITGDILLSELESIYISNNAKGLEVGRMILNQVDPELQSIAEVSPSLLNVNNSSDISFDYVELNNFKYLNFAYARGFLNDIVFNEIKISYSNLRISDDIYYPDSCLLLGNPTAGAINGIHFNKIKFIGKAPRLINTRAPGSHVVDVDDIVFKNVSGSTDKDLQQLFNIRGSDRYFNYSNVKLINVNLNGYAPVPRYFRDDYNIDFIDCMMDGLKSDHVVLIVGQSGQTTITVPLNYLISPPRFVVGGRGLPPYKTSFANHEMTITFLNPLDEYVEEYVRIEN